MEPILSSGEPPRIGESSRRPDRAVLESWDLEYLEARAVPEDVALEAGARTARKPSEIPQAFPARQRRSSPALVAPHHSPDGDTTGFQVHPKHPGKTRKGKVLKWVSPKGARLVLATHPRTADEVRRGSGRLWLPEGWTRMLALTALGETAASYAGADCWKQDGSPLRCFDYTNLSGRLVLDVPDADYRVREGVQRALGERVAFLESRGARVLVVSIPPVDGDEHAGLDDYLAAGGDLEALARDARPFEPVDVGRERLTKDERLRRIVGVKVLEAAELPTRKDPECNAAKVARLLAGTLAPNRGKMRPRGVEVGASFREIAEGVRLGSLGTVSKALDLLDDVGYLEIQRAPKGGRAASSYLLLDPARAGCALGVHKEGQRVGGKEGLKGEGERETPLHQRDSYTSVHPTHIPPDPRALPDAPALRNSKLVHTFEYKGSKRTVVDSQYFPRYGSKRELIVRYLLERGACVETAELMEKFGSKTARPGRFFATWIRPMVKDGVLRGDSESVEMSPGWRDALEAVRGRTDEDEDNRRQSEKYARQRRDRRARFEGEKLGTVAEPEPTPELMGPERVKEIFAADAERDHAARVEEQRRKAGTTAAVFLVDEMGRAPAMRWRELREAWILRGGKGEDLRGAVVSGPYAFRREAADGDALYVYAGREVINSAAKKAGDVEQDQDPAGDVLPLLKGVKESAPSERPDNPANSHLGAGLDPFRNTPRPGRGTLTNVDISDGPRKLPPKVGGEYRHGPECACWICEDEPAVEVAGIGASA